MGFRFKVSDMSNELDEERVSFYVEAEAFIRAQEKHLGKLISENSELKEKVYILVSENSEPKNKVNIRVDQSVIDTNDWLKNLECG